MLQSSQCSGGAFGKRRPEKGQVHEELTMPQRQPTIPYSSGRSGAASLCDPARFCSRFILFAQVSSSQIDFLDSIRVTSKFWRLPCN